MPEIMCVDAKGTDHLTEGKVYITDYLGGFHTTSFHFVMDDSNRLRSFRSNRFKPVEEESPKMGAIYLVCAIEVGSLEKDSYDVVASSNTATSYIEHTLEGAKKKCEKVQEYLKTEDLLTEYTACIFELHSYFENRPFFVEVRSVH